MTKLYPNFSLYEIRRQFGADLTWNKKNKNFADDFGVKEGNQLIINSFVLFGKTEFSLPKSFSRLYQIYFFLFCSRHYFIMVLHNNKMTFKFWANGYTCFLREFRYLTFWKSDLIAINHMFFYKTINPAFAFVLSIIQNFLSKKKLLLERNMSL